MHELQVTESILSIVLRHAEQNRVRKVVAIHLRIGELSDLENEWIQRYFDYLSKDTLAEGAKLEIERAPVVMQCNAGSHNFEVDIRQTKDIRCPECGDKECKLISGREYYIKHMEVL
jgi:hydrogenase nickel incorporation protein HypA/HybF